MPPSLDRRLSIAPMMDWTDCHDRYFLRLITRRALLYTEMIPAGAILHGDRARFLAHDAAEHPLALQVGGSDPADLAECARIAAEHGFDEINLNVGCPSDRVQSGRFGAALMAAPGDVAAIIAAMRQATDIPVTVKCRIGIDDQPVDRLWDFVGRVRDAGCGTFIIHARKAWLKGLSPKENREIPPLDYAVVHRVKQDFPDLEIILNGGLTSLDQVAAERAHVDGAMIGREAYHNPYFLAPADRRLFGVEAPVPSRAAVIEAFIPYVERQLAAGVRLHHMTRHILGLAHGLGGARAWRRHLSDHAGRPGAGVDVIRQAMVHLDQTAWQAAA